MQTPGGSARPSRHCGKPKRFDDTDSQDESPVRAQKQTAAVQGSQKRKAPLTNEEDLTFDTLKPAKRQKILTPKLLNYCPSLAQQTITNTPAPVAVKKVMKAGPKSMQEKWKAKADMNTALRKFATDSYKAKVDKVQKLKFTEENDKDDRNKQGDDLLEEGGEDEDEEEEEENEEEDLEGMLSEYRQMFSKPTVDMTKMNAAIANGGSGIMAEVAVRKPKEACRDCIHYKDELDNLEEMIKLKDCELQEILKSITNSQLGGPKQENSYKDNIEKRIMYHKKLQETDKKLRNVEATRDKWESLYNSEAGKVKDLELRCEALELKLKLEQKKISARKPGCIEVPATKVKELMEIKNYHSKNCFNMKEQLDLLTKEKTTTLRTMQKNDIDYKNKFIRMKKHYHTLLDHYIQKDLRFSKRKDILDKKIAVYKDVGSRQQILRDASRYLNANQMAFLEGQLTTEKTLCGKSNGMPVKYKELLLSIYQNSIITYKILKSYNFNIPPLLSIQQLSQSEVCNPSDDQFALLNEKSNPVPADRRTLRALASDEEDQEIADLLDASAKQQQDQSIMSEEEAEDGVDGDYGDGQPEENNEEEEEEGGADYLSDDDPGYHRKMKQQQANETNGGVGVSLEQQQDEFQSDLQQQLDNQLSSQLTAEPQFETLEHELVDQHEVHAMDRHQVHEIQQHQVHEVHSMDHVVQEVTHVDQLVDSMDTIEAQQIEISDMNPSSIGVVDHPVDMVNVDAQQMLHGIQVEATTDDSMGIVTVRSGAITEAMGVTVSADDGSSDCSGLDAIAAAAADAALVCSLQSEGGTTEKTIAIVANTNQQEGVHSAETEVAERGPDMPLL